MKGEQGIPLSFQLQNRTKSRSFTIHVEISNNILRGPQTQPNQNNMQIRPLGATLSEGCDESSVGGKLNGYKESNEEGWLDESLLG